MLKFVRDYMRTGTEIPMKPLGTEMSDAVVEMSAKGLGCVCIVNDAGEAVGIITDGDLRRALRTHEPQSWASIQAADLMTTDPITAAPDQLAVAALELMERNRRKSISVMPVQAASGELVGLLRLHDLVQAGLSRASNATTDVPQAA